MVILSLVCNFNFEKRWGDCPTFPNSGYATGIISNLPLLLHHFPMCFLIHSVFPHDFASSAVPPPSSLSLFPLHFFLSSSSTSFCAWAYFESGPILWYYILRTTLFPSPPSSFFPLLPSHSFPPSLLLPSLPSSCLLPFLPSFLPSPLPSLSSPSQSSRLMMSRIS